MKFKIDIAGTSVFLSPEQLGQLVIMLGDATRIEEKYVGTGKGPNGASYIKLIRSYQPSEHFRPYCVTDDEYAAMELVTKLEDEKNGTS
jgi:hypothetical protein